MPFISIFTVSPTVGFAGVGRIVALAFTASETLSVVTATIAGRAATVTNPSGLNYQATITVQSDDVQGPATFSIAYADQVNNAGVTRTTVTDTSSVTIG